MAILLVLVFHAGLTTFEGGYVGVDVFFVLSGFLITGIIARELGATGTVSLAGFYARRARRLLPASAMVLVVTLGVSALLLPAFRLPAIALDVGSAALDVSNVRFAVAATDYFATADPPSPVLHFWSLSLEEQFYLFWPAILLVAHRRGGMQRLRTVVFAIGAASLVGCILLTADEPAWAFYLLPTRAWELALGGLVALSLPALARMPGWVAGWAALAGIALIAFAALTFSGATAFPGLAATIPAGGSALIVAAGAITATTPISALLSIRPLRFLGRISYSLYLWHWPLLVDPGRDARDRPVTRRRGAAERCRESPSPGSRPAWSRNRSATGGNLGSPSPSRPAARGRGHRGAGARRRRARGAGRRSGRGRRDARGHHRPARPRGARSRARRGRHAQGPRLVREPRRSDRLRVRHSGFRDRGRAYSR